MSEAIRSEIYENVYRISSPLIFIKKRVPLQNSKQHSLENRFSLQIVYSYTGRSKKANSL